MSRAPLHPISHIKAMLAARIDHLAPELLPGGKRDGAEWRCGSLAGEPGQSLAVHLRGDKAGVWCDFAGGPDDRGDALDLVARVHFRGDIVEALRWSRAWLGLDTPGRPFTTHRPAAPAPRPKTPEVDEDYKRLTALRMWLEAKPIPGTPAAEYLAARGLDLRRFGRAPGALRFDPANWCAEAKQPLPAMLAAITRKGEHVATHRTWLMQERGTWRKARLDTPKKVLGGLRGGIIPLWRGRAGTSLREITPEETLAIAEGIEDALTIAWHQPDWRCAAAVSLGNMAGLHLPDGAADVVLIFDRDGENVQAARARRAAEQALLQQGRSVRVTTPPEGFKDFNAWHMALPQAERMPAA